jgi:hypothetical protein
MLRCALAATLIAFSLPTHAEDGSALAQKLLPPGVTRAEFFGDLLAIIAFCNLTNQVDQYEVSAGMRFFGVTSADRPAMEAARDKRYEVYRRQYSTWSKHTDFCTNDKSHLLLSKIMRRGFHSFPGSDDRRQDEKIEVFGTALGTMMFCKIPVDGDKWGQFLFDMGVKSESLTALTNQTRTTHQALLLEHGNPQKASQLCAEVKLNPSVERFIKR